MSTEFGSDFLTASTRTPLWDMLVSNYQGSVQKTITLNSYTILCGQKGSGQSSLISKNNRRTAPTSTVGVDYRCTTESYGIDSCNKKVTHIYDIGGDSSESDLLCMPLTSQTIEHASVLICLDMSRPSTVFRDAITWIDHVFRRVERCMSELEESKDGRIIADRMRKNSLRFWEDCSKLDAPPPISRIAASPYSRCTIRENIQKCPIPVFLVATNWDRFLKNDPSACKKLTRSLRILSMMRGIGLVSCALVQIKIDTATAGVSSSHLSELQEQHQKLKRLIASFAKFSNNQNKSTVLRKKDFDSDSDSDSDNKNKNNNGANDCSIMEASAEQADVRVNSLISLGRALRSTDHSHAGLFIVPGFDKDLELIAEDQLISELQKTFLEADKNKDTKEAEPKEQAAFYAERGVDEAIAHRTAELSNMISDMSRQYRNF